ncbi:MAG: glycosyltransferase [Candidatus Micrarchaeia archaeon]
MRNNSEFTLILPTLNEEATIGKLINYVLLHYRGMRVLVVDDGSTDGTERIVNGISKAHKEVRLINRKKLGLAKGLTASIVQGILASKTKYAIVMDADLQHPPEVIGKLADCLAKGNDMAVATRARVRHWALYRKLISKGLMLFGKLVLVAKGKKTCKDIFSGFFGIRQKLFASTYASNKERFVGYGYKALFDFLKCADSNIRLCEVPYAFMTRKSGKSKAGIRQGLALFRSFFT